MLFFISRVAPESVCMFQQIDSFSIRHLRKSGIRKFFSGYPFPLTAVSESANPAIRNSSFLHKLSDIGTFCRSRNGCQMSSRFLCFYNSFGPGNRFRNYCVSMAFPWKNLCTVFLHFSAICADRCCRSFFVFRWLFQYFFFPLMSYSRKNLILCRCFRIASFI